MKNVFALAVFVTCAVVSFTCCSGAIAAEESGVRAKWLRLVDGMEASRRELKTGSYSARGNMSGFTKQKDVDGNVVFLGYFDIPNQRSRLDRNEPKWATKNDVADDDVAAKRTISSHIFTPKHSVFYADAVGIDHPQGRSNVSILSPEKRSYQYFQGKLDVQSLGLHTSYSDLRFGRTFDKQMKFFRRGKVSPAEMAAKEGLTIVATFVPYDPPNVNAEIQEELWVDETRGFTPVHMTREVYEFVEGERILSSRFTTDTSWMQNSEVWVPKSYRLQTQRFWNGKTRTSVTLELEFTWNSVNSSLDAALFDHKNLQSAARGSRTRKAGR